MIFSWVWVVRSTASNFMNLWYICGGVCVCVISIVCCLSAWDAQKFLPTRGDQVQANRKAVFFFVCSYWLSCVLFFLYSVWIIYYYYYSITISEIKKEVCRRKKKMSDFPLCFLFFVLCCSIFVAENQENQKCLDPSIAQISQMITSTSIFRFAISEELINNL